MTLFKYKNWLNRILMTPLALNIIGLPQHAWSQSLNNGNNILNGKPSNSMQSSASLFSQDQLKLLLTSKPLLRAGSSLLETSELYKVYALKQFKSFWGNSIEELQNNIETIKPQISQITQQNGLIYSDYFNTDLEGYLTQLNPENALAVELLLTQGLMKLAKDLNTGLIDPNILDNDIRFKKKTFTQYDLLSRILTEKNNFVASMDQFSPQNKLYKSLQKLHLELVNMKANGGFKSFKGVRATIKLGSAHDLVPSIRERVKQHGYNLMGTGKIYDQELSLAVQEIQKENGYLVNSDLLNDSGFWNIMEATIDVRLNQVAANLEKLRWLPSEFEASYIFVNTNATEVSVIENNVLVNKFKSINGRGLRRTPMMKTYITHVILNPRWTATDSIVLQDKLPEIQKNVKYLDGIRMKVYSRKTGSLVNPASLDWVKNPRQVALNHTFVMDPGPKNALGVYKFPLVPELAAPMVGNSDAIYMHYTDDPSLFSKTSRHLSSGCVRLEQAEWLAGFLLKNNPLYSPEMIRSLVSKGTEGEQFQADMLIKLAPNDYRPVYTLPLTVEILESGKARYLKDVYTIDQRIIKNILSANIRSEIINDVPTVESITFGKLQVSGVPGLGQNFGFAVAQRCEEPKLIKIQQKGSVKLTSQCEPKVKIPLNQDVQLKPGKYIVGFENTVFPGFVQIESQKTANIALEKINLSASAGSHKMVRIYRDLTTLTEQKKIYFEKFMTGSTFFRQGQYNFGDLYVAGNGMINQIEEGFSSYCADRNLSNLKLVSDIREHAMYVCETLQNANSMWDMADLYRFSNFATFQEAVVGNPGDIFPRRYGRLLVSAPVRGTEFVSVMPGEYQISSELLKTPIKVQTQRIIEDYPEAERKAYHKYSMKVDVNEISEDIEDDHQGLPNPNGATTNFNSRHKQCESVALWRTESRSYCTQDSQPGCDRQTAQQCTELKLDLRFKR